MELCGQTLAAFIRGERVVSESRIDTGRAQIMWDIATGIEFIHGCNSVHRDLKPLNSTPNADLQVLLIIVLYSTKEKVWKIADFGLSLYRSGFTQVTDDDAMGTSGYRSPELLRFDGPSFSNKSDIWWIGCIIFELVTGVRLFESDHTVMMYVRDPEGPLARFQDAIIQYLAGFTLGLLDADREWIVTRLVSTISIEGTERPSASGLKGAFHTLLAAMPDRRS